LKSRQERQEDSHMKNYTFSPIEKLVLDLNLQSEQAFKSLLPAARAALYEALGFDSDVAWNSSFEVLAGLEERAKYFGEVFESTAVGYANRAGIVAAEGESWSTIGNTIRVVPAVSDDLSEVAALSGTALFSHEKYPELVNTAKEIFREAAFEFAANNPSQVSPGEVADTVAFIENFSDAAVADTRPVSVGVQS
jgi:hypothetical protein